MQVRLVKKKKRKSMKLDGKFEKNSLIKID